MRFGFVFCVLTITLGVQPHRTLSPTAEAVLGSLRTDRASLAHLHIDAVRPTLVIERALVGPAGPLGFLFHRQSISASKRCEWRGLPPDSIVRLVQAPTDTHSSGPADSSITRAAPFGNSTPELVVFVSPEFYGMSWVGVFSFNRELERRGGQVSNYASFNQGIEYVVCGSGRSLEVLGPFPMWYD